MAVGVQQPRGYTRRAPDVDARCDRYQSTDPHLNTHGHRHAGPDGHERAIADASPNFDPPTDALSYA